MPRRPRHCQASSGVTSSRSERRHTIFSTDAAARARCCQKATRHPNRFFANNAPPAAADVGPPLPYNRPERFAIGNLPTAEPLPRTATDGPCRRAPYLDLRLGRRTRCVICPDLFGLILLCCFVLNLAKSLAHFTDWRRHGG